jgi:hypothetical protein
MTATGNNPALPLFCLLISSVDPCTMFRFFGGVALAAATVALVWATQSQSQPPLAVPRIDPAASSLHRTGGKQPLYDDWFAGIFESAPRRSEPESDRPRGRDDRPEGGTYRPSALGSATGSTFPSATRPGAGGSRGMLSNASGAVPPGPGSSYIATPVRMSMRWSTSMVAPIAACPRRSCTELNTSRTVPVAATPGTRQQSRGIALTLKRPSKPWLASLPLTCLRFERSMAPETSKAGLAASSGSRMRHLPVTPAGAALALARSVKVFMDRRTVADH